MKEIDSEIDMELEKFCNLAHNFQGSALSPCFCDIDTVKMGKMRHLISSLC
jgi:hypothetical protein